LALTGRAGQIGRDASRFLSSRAARLATRATCPSACAHDDPLRVPRGPLLCVV